MDLKTLRNELRAMADKEAAAHHQRFFKTGPGEYGEGDVFLGIRVPHLRRLAKQARGLATTSAEKLLASRFHEERLVALFIIVQAYADADDAGKKGIYECYLANTRHINNWDLVDASAEHIVGAYLLERSKKPLHVLARSDSLWERRIAIIATFCFIRHRRYAETLRIARMLLCDDHDLIHKAAGWMLREVGKRDRAVEEEFLRAHYPRMPRTMLRYAIEKFPEATRKRYLEGSI